MNVVILIPVLRRPKCVRPVLEGFRGTVPGGRIVFLADRSDRDEIAELQRCDADYFMPGGSYAEKIRVGIERTDEELIFTAADDLAPQIGWLEAALGAMADGIEVVGVNDLIDRKRSHATHFLMTRRYAESPTIDGGPGPFHLGYRHWYCDDELIATARKRGVYAYAKDSHVKHLHPMVDRARDDSTYRRGRAKARQDRRLFESRVPLWT